MKFIKDFWDKIKKPKGVLLVLFYVAFFLFLSATLTLVILIEEQTILHFVLYACSGLSLAYFVYTIVYFAPMITQKIIEKLKKHKFTNSLLENYGYRTLVFSFLSFVINVIYVVFLLVLGIMGGSIWQLAITAYYVVLIVIKGLVFYAKKKHNDFNSQCVTMRTCGILFILLTLAFSGIIVLIYKTNSYFEYAGLLIYAVAAYTFLNLTVAICNLFKARRQDDLYVQTMRNINLANAVVSIVVLQVALFQAFSPESNLGFANGLTGGAVSAIILLLGIYMIQKANKKLKEGEKQNEERE